MSERDPKDRLVPFTAGRTGGVAGFKTRKRFRPVAVTVRGHMVAQDGAGVATRKDYQGQSLMTYGNQNWPVVYDKVPNRTRERVKIGKLL
jgi:hypothetical protein